MNRLFFKRLCGALLVAAASAMVLSGCVGMVIGAATDVAIEVAKVPFKVGGAVVDVANGDDDNSEE